MHSSHMQAEALMGYLGFCIRHVKSEYSSCRIVVKVYKHISIQSNGIEDREFNSNRGIHHLFFTVNEEKRMFKMKRIESAESSSLLFKEILHRCFYILFFAFSADAVILPSMTIYGKVLCPQPATSTFNEGFSNGSRRSFINTGFLYYCPCHIIAEVVVSEKNFSRRRRPRLRLRAYKNLHMPSGYASSILLHNICPQAMQKFAYANFLCPEAMPRALPEAIFQKFLKFSNF
ncbi:hypothetical protein T4A_2415 [Trichinella pseudospiralis]|uniref:Uncharacterized protein n=1 Tax=Trichinella pseudospiralis TaxID=6337 RepID=A0A0V1DT53_TRIPS|nr:hypothetical protein T4A_2415 [Trichinella pseudospiralis]